MDDPTNVTRGAAEAERERYEAFVVEQRGIDFIPETERHATPQSLFWMWQGALWNIFYVVYGALVVAIGLSLPQAIAIILVGNLSYALLGLASLQGPAAGTSTFAIARAPYGPRGDRVLSLFNWMTVVGYEAAGLILIVLAAVGLMGEAGVTASTASKVVLILVVGAVQLTLPLYGHATITKVLGFLTYPFVGLFIVMTVLVVPKLAHVVFSQHASWETVTIALALVISAGGLGWSNMGNDYSRYLPRQTSGSATFFWVSLGAAIPSVLLELLGAGVATITLGATDPISGLPRILPSWFLVPYLCVAIVQLFAINTINLYSSGLTLQAIGLKIRRWQAVVVDTVVCIGIAFVAVFSSRFNQLLSNFLLFVIVWLAPYAAIFLVDWVLRRGQYDPQGLLQGRGGLYWRHGGVHVPGLVAQFLGMAAALMWIDTSVYKGPLSNLTNGADFSVFMGFAVGGLTYGLLAGSRVREEAKR